MTGDTILPSRRRPCVRSWSITLAGSSLSSASTFAPTSIWRTCRTTARHAPSRWLWSTSCLSASRSWIPKWSASSNAGSLPPTLWMKRPKRLGSRAAPSRENGNAGAPGWSHWLRSPTSESPAVHGSEGADRSEHRIDRRQQFVCLVRRQRDVRQHVESVSGEHRESAAQLVKVAIVDPVAG